MISIREVAKMAGVSPATVSRVMNGTANVAKDKKEKVLQVIQETGFQPNEAARTLYKKSARIIGVIVPNIDNPFFNEIAKAIEAEAYRNNYRLTLCSSDNNIDKELHNIELLKRMNADGIVLLTNGGEAFRKVTEFRIPVVVMDREVTCPYDVTYIEADHYEGGRLGMEYLLERGCRNIVYMRGPQNLSSGRKRFEGYLDACRKHSLPPQYVNCQYNYEDGLRQTRLILEQYPTADGIIASNDLVALSAYKVLHAHGKRVPEDVQLIGFDNIQLSRIMTPELTTIEQPLAEMGRKAVQALISSIENGEPSKNYTFRVRIIERDTTR